MMLETIDNLMEITKAAKRTRIRKRP